MTTRWRDRFEATYRGPPSRVEERIWRDAFGDEYPDGLDPYSYITRSELERFIAELQLSPGEVTIPSENLAAANIGVVRFHIG